MKLSVAIVNHNQKVLLKRAIDALITSCQKIDYEIIIIDNASIDGSIDLVKKEFPNLPIIANKENAGIARSYNQALKMCSGEYVLLVTADTICGKDSLTKMVEFMDEHSNAAALSVRLLSPQGRFIPESIHGLSSTWGGFFKLIGFAKHLQKTRLYDNARKDWVEEFQVTEIDIVHGESMFIRRSSLNAVGLFDERFVQYGYDIDLSYRLRLAGFKNYYFPKTYFFKYDDPADRKISWDYIRYLYSAMFIFALKYLLHVPVIKIPGLPQIPAASYELKG